MSERWDRFRSNVENWAKERKLYEQSTETHQQVKALEEIGEYLLATNDEERMMEIGDIAVCIINAAVFRPYNELGWYTVTPMHVGKLSCELLRGCYNLSLSVLKTIAERHHYDFMDCCELTWNKIKDRDGETQGGFFIKEIGDEDS